MTHDENEPILDGTKKFFEAFFAEFQRTQHAVAEKVALERLLAKPTSLHETIAFHEIAMAGAVAISLMLEEHRHRGTEPPPAPLLLVGRQLGHVKPGGLENESEFLRTFRDYAAAAYMARIDAEKRDTVTPCETPRPS